VIEHGKLVHFLLELHVTSLYCHERSQKKQRARRQCTLPTNQSKKRKEHTFTSKHKRRNVTLRITSLILLFIQALQNSIDRANDTIQIPCSQHKRQFESRLHLKRYVAYPSEKRPLPQAMTGEVRSQKVLLVCSTGGSSRTVGLAWCSSSST